MFNSITCKINSLQYSNYTHWITYDGTTHVMGLEVSSQNNGHAGYIKFTTPSFIGKQDHIKVDLPINSIIKPSGASYIKLNYALCSSNANKQKYVQTTISVEDEYQIYSGTTGKIYADDTLVSFEIPINTIKPNTAYYIYLLADRYSSDAGVYLSKTINDYKIIVAVEGGFVCIDNGSKFDYYICYIDNGSSWDEYVAYVDDGSKWNLCG